MSWIKKKLRTIEARTVQRLKNNEARHKFTGSFKNKEQKNKQTKLYFSNKSGPGGKRA